MPAQSNEADLYTRGKYRLAWDRKRDGSLRSPFLQIIWYDADAGRFRQRSTATADVAEAEQQLDRLYLEKERGQAICHACGQPLRSKGRHLVTAAMADYLTARESRPSFTSIRSRLGHVSAYLSATDRLDTTCEAIDGDWIDAFRKWAIEVPIVAPVTKRVKQRGTGTVEASVRQLAAAINFAHARHDTTYPAAFTAKKPSEVSQTPSHRSDVKELAAMFRYALEPNAKGKARADRAALLHFLRVSVATWARPDAAHDVSTDPARKQWLSAARVLNLNPAGRAQTRKWRPTIPVARQFAPHLDKANGFYVGIESVRTAFNAMLDDLKLPRDGETGLKLIRRSMATLARRRLGEEHWVQGEKMLGHRKVSTSDVYALMEPGQLGRALAVTEAIVDEIEKLAPGAFHRERTGLRLVAGGRK
jgi:hypothetical protein